MEHLEETRISQGECANSTQAASEIRIEPRSLAVSGSDCAEPLCHPHLNTIVSSAFTWEGEGYDIFAHLKFSSMSAYSKYYLM